MNNSRVEKRLPQSYWNTSVEISGYHVCTPTSKQLGMCEGYGEASNMNENVHNREHLRSQGIQVCPFLHRVKNQNLLDVGFGNFDYKTASKFIHRFLFCQQTSLNTNGEPSVGRNNEAGEDEYRLQTEESNQNEKIANLLKAFLDTLSSFKPMLTLKDLSPNTSDAVDLLEDKPAVPTGENTKVCFTPGKTFERDEGKETTEIKMEKESDVNKVLFGNEMTLIIAQQSTFETNEDKKTLEVKLDKQSNISSSPEDWDMNQRSIGVKSKGKRRKKSKAEKAADTKETFSKSAKFSLENSPDVKETEELVASKPAREEEIKEVVSSLADSNMIRVNISIGIEKKGKEESIVATFREPLLTLKESSTNASDVVQKAEYLLEDKPPVTIGDNTEVASIFKQNTFEINKDEKTPEVNTDKGSNVSSSSEDTDMSQQNIAVKSKKKKKKTKAKTKANARETFATSSLSLKKENDVAKETEDLASDRAAHHSHEKENTQVSSTPVDSNIIQENVDLGIGKREKQKSIVANRREELYATAIDDNKATYAKSNNPFIKLEVKETAKMSEKGHKKKTCSSMEYDPRRLEMEHREHRKWKMKYLRLQKRMSLTKLKRKMKYLRLQKQMSLTELEEKKKNSRLTEENEKLKHRCHGLFQQATNYAKRLKEYERIDRNESNAQL